MPVKKLFLALFLFVPSLWSASQTTRAGVTKPAFQDPRWDITLNNNFDILDTSAAFQGTSNTFTGTNVFTGAGVTAITYGMSVGSMTVSNLAVGECVQTTTGGRLTTSGAACGSGSGSGSGLINAATQTAVPRYSVSGSSNVLSGSSTFTTDGTNVSLTGNLSVGLTAAITNVSASSMSATFGISAGSLTLTGTGPGALSLNEGTATATELGIAQGVSVMWASASSDTLVMAESGVIRSTFTIGRSSVNIPAGNFLSSSGNGRFVDGGLTSAVPVGPTWAIQFSCNGVLSGNSGFQYNGSSITVVSSITFNTQNGNAPFENNIPAYVSFFLDDSPAQGRALANWGSNLEMNQFYVPERMPVVSNNGITANSLRIGYDSQVHQIASINSLNNEVNFWSSEGGVTNGLSIKTDALALRDIVLMPQGTATVRISSNAVTIISSATIQGQLSVSTATFSPSALFAGLAASPDGTMRYCSDCTTATPATCTANLLSSCICAGSGTGAFAKRINGEWYCQ